MQFGREDVAFIFYSFGRSPETLCCINLCVSLILILLHRSSVPRRRSVCCIGSKIALLCGVVRFITGLTGWSNNSWFFVVWGVCIIGVAINGAFVVVGVGVCSTTEIITIFIVTGTIFVGVSLVSLFLELTTMTLVVAWILQWQHVGLAFSGFGFVACCVTVFIFISSGTSQPFSSKSFSRRDTFGS